MQLAIECRQDMLEILQHFADFDWVRADEVLKDEAYAEHFRQSDKVKFVCGFTGNGEEPIPTGELLQAYDSVRGFYLVVPTPEIYAELAKEDLKSQPRIRKDRLIGVLQGETFHDAFACLATYEGVVAVPYNVCSKGEYPPWLMAVRRALLVTNLPADRFVHLLGFNSLDEFFWYESRPNVMSLNTGIPVLLGLQGLDILDPLESKEKPTFDQMRSLELNDLGLTAIYRNIGLLRRYMP